MAFENKSPLWVMQCSSASECKSESVSWHSQEHADISLYDLRKGIVQLSAYYIRVLTTCFNGALREKGPCNMHLILPVKLQLSEFIHL